MNYFISHLPEVEDDIMNAMEWYSAQRAGLDDDFLLAFEVEIIRILKSPLLYGTVKNKIRRALIARFPYAIFFIVERTTILILAVVHQKRKPSVWKTRKKKN